MFLHSYFKCFLKQIDKTSEPCLNMNTEFNDIDIVKCLLLK